MRCCVCFSWKCNFYVRLCYVTRYGGFSILNTLYSSNRNGSTKFQCNSLLFQPVMGNGTMDVEGMDLNLLTPLNKVWFSLCQVSCSLCSLEERKIHGQHFIYALT